MLNKETVDSSTFETDLKESNEGNFGPSKLLQFLDHCLIDLVKTLKLKSTVTSSVFDKLFIKEIMLDTTKPDNFTEVIVKYKSAGAAGRPIDTVRSVCTMAKLNHELSKLENVLSKESATKISDFIRKLVYYNSKDFIFEVDVYVDDFYLSLTIFSPKDFQSMTVEIF